MVLILPSVHFLRTDSFGAASANAVIIASPWLLVNKPVRTASATDSINRQLPSRVPYSPEATRRVLVSSTAISASTVTPRRLATSPVDSTGPERGLAFFGFGYFDHILLSSSSSPSSSRLLYIASPWSSLEKRGALLFALRRISDGSLGSSPNWSNHHSIA